MSDPLIMAEVSQIIRRTFRQPGAQISRETQALDIDGWDSLSHTTLILEVEKRFDVRLPPDRVFDLADVGELVDLIAQATTARR